jgi:Fe-S-cluster containining protein
MGGECQRCGACCHGLDVLLSDAEAEQFESDPKLLALTVLRPWGAGPPLRFMKRHKETDRCVALGGVLGECACGIYARRPGLCRDFAAGSEDCQAARRERGFEDQNPPPAPSLQGRG